MSSLLHHRHWTQRENKVHIRKCEGKQGVTYQAIVKVKGKSESATFPTKAQAREWGTKREAEMLNESFFPEKLHQHKTLGDAITRYRERELPQFAPNTIKSRKTTLVFWEKNLGDTLFNNIDAPLVEDYLHLLQQQGYAPNSINRFREMLSILFNLASSPSWNMTKNNPMKYTQKRKSPPERLPMLSLQQQEDLLNACKEAPKAIYLYLFVLFVLRTGGRHNEVLKAKWEQINWTQRTVRFMNTKGKIDRIVPLDGRLYKELKRWYDDRELDSVYVFENAETKKPYWKMDIAFKYAKKRLTDFPKDITVHDLRHIFASNCTEVLGLDIGIVSQLLGHKRLQDTMRYRHLRNEHLASALKDFEGAVEQAKSRANIYRDADGEIVIVKGI
jgi:integrase